MCVVCGCATVSHADPGPAAALGRGPDRPALVGEAAPGIDPATGDLHYGLGAARVSVPGMSTERTLRLEADVLGANQRHADHNRAHFDAHGVTALNLVSSPGAGKTTLLCATIRALRARHPALDIAVIEGDQQTSFDADRIRATGVPAVQVNTGKGCHLDAPMVGAAFAQLHGHGIGNGHEHEHDSGQGHGHEPGSGHAHEHGHAHAHSHGHAHDHAHGHAHGHDHAHSPARADEPSLLFIENVGNLVCPAAWDLGERAKVAILSVTEGEDKPLKYPDMFAAARLMLLNKIDLLPHVNFDRARCIELARRVNPAIEVIELSATTGEGMDAWLRWLDAALRHEPFRSAGDRPSQVVDPSLSRSPAADRVLP